MNGTIELHFERPVGDEISPKGEFGAYRHYGPHKGVDFLSMLGTRVKASEGGVVVYSSERPGSKEKTKYGHVIVIDHTPGADDDQRHIREKQSAGAAYCGAAPFLLYYYWMRERYSSV